jgi:hypothetical protein
LPLPNGRFGRDSADLERMSKGAIRAGLRLPQR